MKTIYILITINKIIHIITSVFITYTLKTKKFTLSINFTDAIRTSALSTVGAFKGKDKNCVIEKLLELGNVLEQIRNDQKKIISLLGSENFRDKEVSIKFPLQSVEQLLELENKCNDSKYASSLKDIIKRFEPPNSRAVKTYSTYGLSQICLDSVLFKYNWDGSQNKLAFNKLGNLNDLIFRTWRGCNAVETYADYVQNIKDQFTAARARINTKVCRLKRSENKDTNKLISDNETENEEEDLFEGETN